MVFYILFFSAFLLAFLLPNHYYPWGSFYLEFSAFLALFFAAFHVSIKNIKIFLPNILMVFVILPVIPLLQWSFGITFFRGDALISFFYLGAFSLSLVVAYNVSITDLNQRITEKIALALLFIGISSVWLAAVQWLQLWSSIWIHDLPAGLRPYANIGQPNNYSTLVWISLFSLFYLFERGRVGHFGIIIAGLFLVAGAALAQSRTPWVVFSVLIFVVLVQCAIFSQWNWRRLVLPLVVMSAFYIFGIASIEVESFLFNSESRVLRTELTDVRTDMWMSFLHAVMEKPWFGFGWGQISVAQLAVSDLYPPAGMTQYSHNLFLDLIIWNGVPAGVLIFLLISVVWLKIFLNAPSEKSFYSLCSFSALLVHAFLEYPHAYGYFLLLAGFFIGISISNSLENKRYRIAPWALIAPVVSANRWLSSHVKVQRVVMFSVVVFFAISLVISWQDYRLLEEDHRLLRFEAASVGTLKAKQKAPDVVLFDQLQSFIWVARTHSFDDLSDQEIERVEMVAMRYPLPMPIFRLAQLRFSQGRPDDAAEAIKVIEHLHGAPAYESSERSLENFAARRDSVVKK